MGPIPDHKYKPNQWLRYERGNGQQQISKVVGATYQADRGWVYKVINPSDQNTVLSIPEENVIEEVESA